MLWISVSAYVLCSQKEAKTAVLLSQRKVALNERLLKIRKEKKEIRLIQQSLLSIGEELHGEFELQNPCCNVCCHTNSYLLLNTYQSGSASHSSSGSNS